MQRKKQSWDLFIKLPFITTCLVTKRKLHMSKQSIGRKLFYQREKDWSREKEREREREREREDVFRK